MLNRPRLNVSRRAPCGLETKVLWLPWGAGDWDLVTAYMRFRKQVFIDTKAWPLTQSEGIEFEQYDTFDTVYVVAHRNRKVVGGARLKRTDSVYGSGRLTYSYMIRDACLDLLPGMPVDLCFDTPPVSSGIWELTRLAASGETLICESILNAANAFLHALGARKCLFLGSPAFLRMARRMGFDPQAIGPINVNADGRFVAFACRVMAPASREMSLHS